MSNWQRVTKENKCPICGKPDWSSISGDKSAVICPRIEQGSKKYAEGSGYLHVLVETVDWKREFSVPEKKQLPEHNEVMAILARKMIHAMNEDRHIELSERLGISTASLKRLNVGFSSNQDAYAFPMTRSGNRLIGIRLRNSYGKKWAIKGSKQGLFIPNGLTKKSGLIICEGPTDTGVLLDLGFNAIGRPSCTSGTCLIKEVCTNKTVVIMADLDGPGLDGAERLKTKLITVSLSVDIVVPPAKDAREYAQQGATRKDFLELIRGPK